MACASHYGGIFPVKIPQAIFIFQFGSISILLPYIFLNFII